MSVHTRLLYNCKNNKQSYWSINFFRQIQFADAERHRKRGSGRQRHFRRLPGQSVHVVRIQSRKEQPTQLSAKERGGGYVGHIKGVARTYAIFKCWRVSYVYLMVYYFIFSAWRWHTNFVVWIHTSAFERGRFMNYLCT